MRIPIILLQPAPSSFDFTANIRVAVLAALCVFLTLFCLEPFNISDMEPVSSLRMSLSFGLITLLITFGMVYLFPKLFPVYTDERNWKVWKEILFVLMLVVTIAIANTLYINYYFGGKFSLKVFTTMVYYTLLIATLPIVGSILIKQQLLLKRYTAEAYALDQNLQFKTVESGTNSREDLNDKPSDIKITLHGDNQGETLSLSHEDLFYIGAEDNYVKISHNSEAGLQQIYFRSSLVNMEEQLSDYVQFYRCHKSFIVNLNNVVHVKGNSQGLKLSFDEIPDEIPVSRSLSGEIRKRLS